MRSSILVILSAFLVAVHALPAASTAAELVMIEERGCIWCARWNKEIAPIYAKTPEGRTLGLRRIDIASTDPDGVTFKRKVVYTPTFVLVEDGRELGRIEGYPGEEFFWGLLDRLLKENAIPIEEGNE
ncbi:hypothetical protein AB1M95_13230 [Sulfitobacter sp. LCG007]